MLPSVRSHDGVQLKMTWFATVISREWTVTYLFGITEVRASFLFIPFLEMLFPFAVKMVGELGKNGSFLHITFAYALLEKLPSAK